MSGDVSGNSVWRTAEESIKEVGKDLGFAGGYFDQLPEKLIRFGIHLLVALVLFIVARKLIRLICKVVDKSMKKARADEGIRHFLNSMLKLGLYSLLIIWIAAWFGFETTSLIAVLGSAGVTLALALQGSLSNITGGVLLMILKPFRIGDYIIEDSKGNEGTVVEIGLIYSLIALSLFISFSILNICDLSTDGCYTLGCAVGAVCTIAGHPILAIPASMCAGACSGFVTALLQTRFGVQSILAGIIVNTGLYTVNLAVMGFSSNLSIFGTDTIFSMFKGLSEAEWWQSWSKLILLGMIVALVCCVIYWFLGTRLGLSIRATGDSPAMVRASSMSMAMNRPFRDTITLLVSSSSRSTSTACTPIMAALTRSRPLGAPPRWI